MSHFAGDSECLTLRLREVKIEITQVLKQELREWSKAEGSDLEDLMIRVELLS